MGINKTNFVKSDRHFINNVHNDNIKREFVEIVKGLRCTVITEGIETIKELNTLHNLEMKLD